MDRADRPSPASLLSPPGLPDVAAPAPRPALLALLRLALRRAIRRPRLWLGLYLLNLGITLLCALPLLLLLTEQLGDRPLADAMARGRADAAMLDLLLNGAGISTSVGLGLISAALLHWLAGVSLSGGLLPALLPPGHPLRVPTDAVLAKAASTLRPMWRLEGLALLGLRLPLVVLVGLVAALISRGQWPLTGTVTLLFACYAPLALLALWLWSALSLVIHVARLRLLAQGAGGASAYRALRVSLRGLATPSGMLATLAGLALLTLLTYSLLIVAGRLGAAALDYRLYVGLAFLLRQLAAMARSLLALFQLATAGELWRSLAESEAQTPL